MAMFSERILAETPELHEEGVRMRFIGRREGVAPGAASSRWSGRRRTTAANDRITLFVAFNYGGRAEILDAARALRRAAARRSSAQLLYAPEMHDPDLIIRTSGEQRLSNYLLWQSAYSELHFTDVLWPDFSRADFEAALGRVRGAPPALRGALMAARAARRRVAPPPRRAARGSDLVARILVAIPAIAFAIFDHLPRAAGCSRSASLALGLRLPARAVPACTSALRPVRAGGLRRRSSGSASRRSARRRRQVLLALVAFLPRAVPARARDAAARAARRSPPAWRSRRSASSGSAWRSRTPCCCAGLDHGDALVVEVLLGTFVGDTGAYLGGRSFGTRRLAPRISPNKTVEGLGDRLRSSQCWRLVRRGIYQDWLSARTALLLGVAVGDRGAARRPLRVADQARRRDARTRAALFGAHGGALDRLDAALFTLVAGYYVWLALLVSDDDRPTVPSASARRRAGR